MRVLVGIFSVLAMASTARATNLNCQLVTALRTSGETVNTLILENVEGDESQLKADLPDQNTLTKFAINGEEISASFSNECDNMYEVSINTDELELIKQGQIQFAHGTVNYSDADGVQASVKMLCNVKW